LCELAALRLGRGVRAVAETGPAVRGLAVAVAAAAASGERGAGEGEGEEAEGGDHLGGFGGCVCEVIYGPAVGSVGVGMEERE